GDEASHFDAWFVRGLVADRPFDVDAVQPRRQPETLTNRPLQLKETAYLTTALRAHLQMRLPDYMVPASILLLERFPLNTSGKVDLAALPAPEAGQGVAFVAPRNPVEAQLVGIWREVLGLETIGVHDNFFELGGHSLLAAQVISRVRSANLSLQDLFSHP